jgi:hypothetical protein
MMSTDEMSCVCWDEDGELSRPRLLYTGIDKERCTDSRLGEDGRQDHDEMYTINE